MFKSSSKTKQNTLADENKGRYKYIELAFLAIIRLPDAVQSLGLTEVEDKPCNTIDVLVLLGDCFSFSHAAVAAGGKESSEDIFKELKEAQVLIDIVCADWPNDFEEEEDDEIEDRTMEHKSTDHFFDYSPEKSISLGRSHGM